MRKTLAQSRTKATAPFMVPPRGVFPVWVRSDFLHRYTRQSQQAFQYTKRNSLDKAFPVFLNAFPKAFPWFPHTSPRVTPRQPSGSLGHLPGFPKGSPKAYPQVCPQGDSYNCVGEIPHEFRGRTLQKARTGSDTAKTLKVRTVARFQYLHTRLTQVPGNGLAVPRQRRAVPRQLPGRGPAGENLQKVGTVARFQYMHDNQS